MLRAHVVERRINQIRIYMESDISECREDWQKSLKERGKNIAWCEISVWCDNGIWNIGSYGGEVWPTAWPKFFKPLPNSIYNSGGVEFTAQGLAYFQQL